ncbi:30S ribosome-binding factor RbfA [Corynebacterium uterequi]|uniref:Ribosome-binding factor A n=1 Tax=Corynebacterium uterequi TaxID=1072256 RepID=A0A0G3HHC4_9CORY|nr:30S ribosome-binding factor RbfA [Corynebacterium uterequi]AKK11328.1 ribosome-binding factor A [Corynebacterium uterequi]
MADHARAGRLAKRIQHIVATALEQNKNHPGLKLVTVTDARVTGDLHDATVYYTVRGRSLDEEPDPAAAAEILNRIRGQVRKTVGEQLGVRFTPTITFELDTMPEFSAHMEQLLAKARARDEELAKLKESAVPAGDANPYKSDDED